MGTSEDSSPDDDPLPARRLTVTDVPHVAERVQRHESRIESLKSEAAALRAAVNAEKRKYAEVSAQAENHIQDTTRTEHVLQARIEALDAEKSDLLALSMQQNTELRQFQDRIQEAEKQGEETEERIQRLMDRLVTLLSASLPADAANVQCNEVLDELADS